MGRATRTMDELWTPRDSILPPEWEAVNYLFAAAQRARETTAVFVPLLMWMSRDGMGGLTALAHEPGGLPAAVDAGLDMVEEHYLHPVWFAVVVDAYGRITDPTDTTVVAEELSDRFVMGDPVVVEQLMLFIAFEGQVRVWRRVYRNTPVDGWEWDDAELMVNPVLPANGLREVLESHASTATG
jgi:hypothetical protein